MGLGRSKSGEILNPSGEMGKCSGVGCEAIGPVGSRHCLPRVPGGGAQKRCGRYRPSQAQQRSNSVPPPPVEGVE